MLFYSSLLALSGKYDCFTNLDLLTLAVVTVAVKVALASGSLGEL